MPAFVEPAEEMPRRIPDDGSATGAATAVLCDNELLAARQREGSSGAGLVVSLVDAAFFGTQPPSQPLEARKVVVKLVAPSPPWPTPSDLG